MREPRTENPCASKNPAGESQNQPFQPCLRRQVSSNRFLRVDFQCRLLKKISGGSGIQGSRVTSDGGLPVVREFNERLGPTGLIQNYLVDSRTGRNTQFPSADLFRQSAYSRLAGYEDLNDAQRLSPDPGFRLVGSEKTCDQRAALTSWR